MAKGSIQAGDREQEGRYFPSQAHHCPATHQPTPPDIESMERQGRCYAGGEAGGRRALLSPRDRCHALLLLPSSFLPFFAPVERGMACI